MKLIFDNILLKLVALLLAVATWTVVTAERRETLIERAYDVPISLIGVPPHLIITTPMQEAVNVRMRGRLSMMRELSSQKLEATVNLTGVRKGEASVVIRPQDINVPPGTDVLSIVPAKLSFRLEERRQRTVPIRPFLVGNPPAGFELGEVMVEPPNALASGPVSMLRDFIEASTERIVVSGRTGTISVSVGVVSDRSLIRIVEPANTRVTIEVVPISAEIPPSTTTATSETIDAPRPKGNQ